MLNVAQLYIIMSAMEKLEGIVSNENLKNSVVNLGFYKYISQSLVNYFDEKEHQKGNKSFSYVELDKVGALKYKDEAISQLGYFILPEDLIQTYSNRIKNANNNKGKYYQNVNQELRNDLEKSIYRIIEYAKPAFVKEEFQSILNALLNNYEFFGNSNRQRNQNFKGLIIAIDYVNFDGQMNVISKEYNNFLTQICEIFDSHNVSFQI